MVTANTVRCKMICNSFIKLNAEQSSAKFSPVLEGSEENKTFFKYTPSGELNLDVDNTNVEFVVGREYYIDIVDATPSENKES